MIGPKSARGVRLLTRDGTANVSAPRIVWHRPRRPPTRDARPRAELALPRYPPRAALRAALDVAGIPRVADASTPRDDAIGLLMLAAEVEHALMVQYLYASHSLRSGPARLVAHVAIEEMGHLITVQNLLLVLGGTTAEGIPARLHLGRDGLRRKSPHNPFPLTLQKVAHSVLARFVVAERP